MKVKDKLTLIEPELACLHRRHGGDVQTGKQPREADWQDADRYQQYADGLAERLPVAPELFGTLLPAGLMLLLVRQLSAIG